MDARSHGCYGNRPQGAAAAGLAARTAIPQPRVFTCSSKKGELRRFAACCRAGQDGARPSKGAVQPQAAASVWAALD